MLRLGVSEKGVTEILAVAEHTVSLTAAAEGLRLDPDVPDAAGPGVAPLVSLLDESEAGDSGETLTEIRGWAADQLGLDRPPDLWRALAHQPRFLKATWAKDRLVMGPGELEPATKVCAALAVAMFRGSRYMTSSLSHQLRHAHGFDDATLVELTAGVMHYVSFNTVAHGMRLPPPHTDMRADEFREG